MRRKNKLVVCRISQIWFAYFGAPGKFHSHCGGEFSNDVFCGMSEKLGVETSAYPVESLFSNGVVEKNKVLYEALMKIIIVCKGAPAPLFLRHPPLDPACSPF